MVFREGQTTTKVSCIYVCVCLWAGVYARVQAAASDNPSSHQMSRSRRSYTLHLSTPSSRMTHDSLPGTKTRVATYDDRRLHNQAGSQTSLLCALAPRRFIHCLVVRRSIAGESPRFDFRGKRDEEKRGKKKAILSKTQIKRVGRRASLSPTPCEDEDTTGICRCALNAQSLQRHRPLPDAARSACPPRPNLPDTPLELGFQSAEEPGEKRREGKKKKERNQRRRLISCSDASCCATCCDTKMPPPVRPSAVLDRASLSIVCTASER